MKLKTSADFNGYWLKGVKRFLGHEGEPCYQGSIYKDGKRVGRFSDDSWGGPMQIDCGSVKKDQELIAELNQIMTDRGEEWIEGYSIFISEILEAWDIMQQIKRKIKTKCIVSLPHHDDNEYIMFKVPFKGNEERLTSYLNDKYGDAYTIVTIPENH